jgi:hypothetical protein
LSLRGYAGVLGMLIVTAVSLRGQVPASATHTPFFLAAETGLLFGGIEPFSDKLCTSGETQFRIGGGRRFPHHFELAALVTLHAERAPECFIPPVPPPPTGPYTESYNDPGEAAGYPYGSTELRLSFEIPLEVPFHVFAQEGWILEKNVAASSFGVGFYLPFHHIDIGLDADLTSFVVPYRRVVINYVDLKEVSRDISTVRSHERHAGLRLAVRYPLGN